MDTTTVKGPELALAVDTFSALEERVVRTIELLRSERERRTSAEKQLASTKEELEMQALEASELRNELAALNKERDAVRQRVEHLLEGLDAIAAP
jgi:septal ring factor EnvC (AmiA/AmiB activator)